MRISNPATHAALTDTGVNDHHTQSHAHDGADSSGTVAHSDATGQTVNDHHNQSHGHTGGDGSGIVSHANATGKTADDHHNENHASRHNGSGADEITALGSPTIADDAAATPTLSKLTKAGLPSAWVAVSGSGTPAIDDDYNVSSITDNDVGDFTVNFATNLTGTTYAVVGAADHGSVTHSHIETRSRAISSVGVNIGRNDSSSALQETPFWSIGVFGGY